MVGEQREKLMLSKHDKIMRIFGFDVNIFLDMWWLHLKFFCSFAIIAIMIFLVFRAYIPKMQEDM